MSDLPLEIKKLERFRTIHSWLWYTLLGVGITIFAGLQLHGHLIGPVIAFDDHINLDGYTYATDHKLKISGSINKVAYLYIDNELQTTNTDGTFLANLYVWPGQSTINIRALDRYGREKKINLKVYDPESASAPDSANMAAKLVDKNFDQADQSNQSI